MKMRALVITGVLLFAITGAAKADDHLFQAESKGLSVDGTAIEHTHAFLENQAGHSGDLAPGQGSPFSGDDMQTPATDTEAANNNAQIKPRELK